MKAEGLVGWKFFDKNTKTWQSETLLLFICTNVQINDNTYYYKIIIKMLILILWNNDNTCFRQ